MVGTVHDKQTQCKTRIRTIDLTELNSNSSFQTGVMSANFLLFKQLSGSIYLFSEMRRSCTSVILLPICICTHFLLLKSEK